MMSRPLLGETSDREKAFPDIARLQVRVVQDPFGQYMRHEWQREKSFTKADIPRWLPCANPRCQQGGIDLQQLALFCPSGHHSFPAMGTRAHLKGGVKALHATIRLRLR